MATNAADNKKYLLSWYKEKDRPLPQLKLNHLYQVEVNLKPPHGNANGVGFDREKWLFRHGIDGIGTIKKLQISEVSFQSVNSYNNQWRTHLSEIINQHFTKPRINALIHALSIGDKSHFDQHDTATFQGTGTAHLIAISGLHIGMVALLGWFIGAFIFKLMPRQSLPKPVLQIILGWVLAILYASLAGWSVSTQRAVIMLLVLGMYQLLRRPSYAWDVWSTSLILVLLFDPLNVLDGGFWLSFMAVAILIFAFSGQFSRPNKALTFIKMQFTLLIGMLPLNLMVFSQLSLIAPVVNLIMIPLMTFLLVPVILLMLLVGSLLNGFPDIMVILVQWISLQFTYLLDFFNQFTWLSLKAHVHAWWQYLLLITGAIWLITPAAIPQRYIGLIMMFFGLYSPQNKVPNKHFTAHFLDVGQGLSVLIETQNHHLLYDVGAAFESGFNMADAVVLPYLQQQQISHLDVLVLSHQDNDHSGAANQLLKKIKASTVWGTEAKHKACLAGQSWIWDGVKFSFLSPYNLIPYMKNNSSCVLKIEGTHTSILLTGDIEEPVEYRLSKTPDINADVLLVPHHGSSTSSSIDFIQAVEPQIAINSSGQYNPFKHPAKEIVNRYSQLNIPFIDTQSSGLIKLNTYPTVLIRETRQEHPNIWRKKSPNKSSF